MSMIVATECFRLSLVLVSPRLFGTGLLLVMQMLDGFLDA
jgi:hypothetical protein